MDTKHLYILLIIGVIILLVAVRQFSDDGGGTEKVSSYDGFAQCLADNGALFYGAYWCPHCNDQKKMFDNSKNLPYVECSTPDGQSQTKVCVDEKITGYPTWRFADGSELSGVREFSELAEKTGCELPQT